MVSVRARRHEATNSAAFRTSRTPAAPQKDRRTTGYSWRPGRKASNASARANPTGSASGRREDGGAAVAAGADSATGKVGEV
jgi:hypothetical protein